MRIKLNLDKKCAQDVLDGCSLMFEIGNLRFMGLFKMLNKKIGIKDAKKLDEYLKTRITVVEAPAEFQAAYSTAQKLNEYQDLTFTPPEALVFSRTCETVARIGMVQIAVLFQTLVPHMPFADARDLEIEVRRSLGIPLSHGSYYGILQNEVPGFCKTCWDAYQYLRREVAWYNAGKDWRTDERDWGTMMFVSFDEPFRSATGISTERV